MFVELFEIRQFSAQNYSLDVCKIIVSSVNVLYRFILVFQTLNAMQHVY